MEVSGTVISRVSEEKWSSAGGAVPIRSGNSRFIVEKRVERIAENCRVCIRGAEPIWKQTVYCRHGRICKEGKDLWDWVINPIEVIITYPSLLACKARKARRARICRVG